MPAIREHACALLGGETAEMPDTYLPGVVDVAGCMLGWVAPERLLGISAARPGDRVLGLGAAGLHTNGYSLARKLFFETAGFEPQTQLSELGMTAGAALLQPHLSYLRPLEDLLDKGVIKGLAHITGGGLTDNIPRILPEGTAVEIAKGSWPVLPVFELMRKIGNVSDSEMYRTFNMGVGMVVVCGRDDATIVRAHLQKTGECYEIGRVVTGNREVSIE